MACMHKETFDIFHNDQIIVPDGYFEIDEGIAPAVQALNRKGYITEWCCSGHPLDYWLLRNAETEYEIIKSTPNSYIAFKEGISLPSLPPGYINNSFDMRLIIRKLYCRDETGFFKISGFILEAMEQLYNWVSGLPDFAVDPSK